jgi:hypothetical protein
MKITGFTAAPPGWRVVWLDEDTPDTGEGLMVIGPMAGWVTGIDDRSGETVIEAATHCNGLRYGTAPSSAWVCPATEAAGFPGGVWKILAPGEPEPAPEEAASEFKRREARYEARQRREATTRP